MAIMNGTYNLTRLAASERVIDLVDYANDSSDQMLVGMFLVGIFFVILLALSKWDFDARLFVGGFVCFLLSLVLKYAQLINILFVMFFFALFAFTGFYMYVVRRD